MVIAAAQTIPIERDTDANILSHSRLIELAALYGTQLIVFPELSLTGYEREHAATLAISVSDQRLDILKALAERHKMIIIAGAPVMISNQLHIGSCIFFPDKSVALYTKQFLHEGEEKFFSPNTNFNPAIFLGEEKIAPAICADISNDTHPHHAAKDNATIYAASLFYTPVGIAEAYRQLGTYAQKYAMYVLMANYGGPSYNLPAGGQSAFWDNKGNLVGKKESDGEGLLIADNNGAIWQAQVVCTT